MFYMFGNGSELPMTCEVQDNEEITGRLFPQQRPERYGHPQLQSPNDKSHTQSGQVEQGITKHPFRPHHVVFRRQTL